MTYTSHVMTSVSNVGLSVWFCLCLAYRTDSKGHPHRGTDTLLRALVEAEIDGVAVANQLTALKEIIDSFTKVNFAPVDRFESTFSKEDALHCMF